jgi:hypothetical protein
MKWRKGHGFFNPSAIHPKGGKLYSRRKKLRYAARALGGRGFLIFTRLSQNSTTGPAIYTDE